MSNYNYEILKEVMRQKNFAKAAAALHLTRSAVSHSVSSLENQWGLTLFVRERTIGLLTKNRNALSPTVRRIRQCILDYMIDAGICNINQDKV